MSERKSFLIYLTYKEQFDLLSDAELGSLIRGIMEYEDTGKEPNLDGMSKMAFSFIKTTLDRDNKKWEDTKNKRSEAGRRGMQSRWNKDNEDNKNDDNTNNVITNDNNIIDIITNDNNVINDITKITDNSKLLIVNSNSKCNSNSCSKESEDVKKVISAYEDNIGQFLPATAELLLSYLDDLTADMIVHAIKIASNRNKKSASYVSGILNSWINKGFKTLSDVQAEEQQQDTTKSTKSITKNNSRRNRDELNKQRANEIFEEEKKNETG